MKKFWEKEWLDIQFADFVEMSDTEIADSVFYDKFYEQLHCKYDSYDDLPESWREDKRETAKDLYELLKGKKKILSIGCGLGYIENQLSQPFAKHGGEEIVALEPSVAATKWLVGSRQNIRVINGYFPQAVEGEQFDAAYSVVIDYCFDDNQYSAFLESIPRFGIKEYILMVSTHSLNWKGKIVHSIRSFMDYVLSKTNLKHRGQFWGYFRSIEEHLNFLRKAGFREFDSGRLPNGVEWIKCLT